MGIKFEIFEYHKSKELLFIGGADGQSNDRDIARLLSLKVEEYQNILINNFNGFHKKNCYEEIFFRNKQDVEKALEWVESAYTLNLLSQKTESQILHTGIHVYENIGMSVFNKNILIR